MPQAHDSRVPNSGYIHNSASSARPKSKHADKKSPTVPQNTNQKRRLISIWAICAVVLSVLIIVVVNTRSEDRKSPNPAGGRITVWNYSLQGEKIAVPVDLDSDGVLRDVVVAYAGKPGGVAAFNFSGEPQWKHDFIPHLGYEPYRLAPIDYDLDGVFDEILLEVRGSTNPPNVVSFGPAAYTFNFWVLNERGEQLWYYQCGYLTSIPGAGISLKCPKCSSVDADLRYAEMTDRYGYRIGSTKVDGSLNRLDLDSTGNFVGIISLDENTVEVSR